MLTYFLFVQSEFFCTNIQYKYLNLKFLVRIDSAPVNNSFIMITEHQVRVSKDLLNTFSEYVPKQASKQSKALH